MSLDERLKLQHEEYLKDKLEIFRQEEVQIQYIKEMCRDFDPPLSEEHFVYSPRIGLLVCYPGIVDKLLGARTRDKENLVDFNQLSKKFVRKSFATGMLYGDKFILLAHPNFRRGYSRHANFDPGFLNAFWRFNHRRCSAIYQLTMTESELI